jgi:hypothetical protein
VDVAALSREGERAQRQLTVVLEAEEADDTAAAPGVSGGA